PVANDDVYSLIRDTTLAVAAPGVLGNDFGRSSHGLSAVLVGQASHGAVGLNGDGSFAYTPAAGYAGPDAVTYKPSDGLETRNVATVAVNVFNLPPVATDDSYVVNQGTPLTIQVPGVLANDFDSNGDPLAAVLLGNPGHGTVSLNADGSFTYAPAAGY